MKNVFLLTLAGILLTSTSPLLAKGGKKSMGITPEELQWMPNPARPDDISTAVVWGDMKKGAHGAFHKFKAGTIVENHSHSANLKAVVIQGTIVTGPESSPKTLGPGSFFTDVAGDKHITKCDSKEDCIFYVDASGKFDIKYAKKSKEITHK